ncbi:MAG: IS5 family transposase [Alphaproteobacteria bacterium]
MSFLLSEARDRLKNNDLVKLNSLIDWQQLRSLLTKLNRIGYGPKGYDPLKLVKALVLQTWHSLSDPGIEEAIKVRLDFMMFSGFDQGVPDETTFCKFRNSLIKLKLFECILNNINQQLVSQGLTVKPSAGAVIDATIIESAARPRKELEAIPIDRKENDVTTIEVVDNLSLSADKDARWLKKGNRSYFGYKGFVVVDAEDGYITKVHMTPANKSEVSTLEDAIAGLFPSRLLGDKGYASAYNRDYLQGKGIKNGLMYKASRNTPLTKWQKLFNKLVLKRRYLVEQGFGILKRKFNMGRASYFTTVKVESQMLLKAIAFNLLKALRKLPKLNTQMG